MFPARLFLVSRDPGKVWLVGEGGDDALGVETGDGLGRWVGDPDGAEAGIDHAAAFAGELLYQLGRAGVNPHDREAGGRGPDGAVTEHDGPVGVGDGEINRRRDFVGLGIDLGDLAFLLC